jgi:hypothetical protein
VDSDLTRRHTETHGDTQDAYDAFEQKMPPPDMGGTDLKDIPEKRRKRREGWEMMGNAESRK